MKNLFNLSVLFAMSLAILFTACNKEDASSKDDDMLKSAIYENEDLYLKESGDFEKVITKPLIKLDDCKYIVEGTIEFRKDGVVIAIIDFGDGTCDDIATKTVDGETTEFTLNKGGDKEKYYKVITEPIVKIEGCDYIVSGVVEFYSYKDDSWLASIDFGDGTCDEWATKYWDGGSKVFSMKK
jgi:hypothetical protein